MTAAGVQFFKVLSVNCRIAEGKSDLSVNFVCRRGLLNIKEAVVICFVFSRDGKFNAVR